MIGVVPRPSSVARRSASSPLAPALGEGPEVTHDQRQPRPGHDPHVCPGRAQLPVRRLHVPPQQLGRPAEVAEGIVGQPQVIGCLHPQGALAERGRELEGLLARRHGAVVVSRDPEYIGHPGQHPSQPSPIVERPGQGLSLAQQGVAYLGLADNPRAVKTRYNAPISHCCEGASL